MANIRYAILFSLLAAATVQAQEKAFPEAPPNMKAAEAQGLHRLSTEELKGFMPGTRVSKGTTGKHKMVHKPDGSVDRKGHQDTTGKWRIDEQSSTYCLDFSASPRDLGKRGIERENCFAVFRAPDGIHNFDFDIKNGFYAHTWRRPTEP